MKKKVGIIGHFGGGKALYDGQTIKTRALFEMLEQTGHFELLCVDTYFNKTNKVKLLWNTLRCLFLCKNIFLLVSSDGMRFFIPFLYFFKKLKKICIFHYIIGNRIIDLVEKEPKFVKYLNAFETNWFEYESGTIHLRKKGVTNVTTLPNFKQITPVQEVQLYSAHKGIYRFCTFSRVTEEKGITDAINAISEINREKGSTVAQLDIYGPVEEIYKRDFSRLLKENEKYVTYKGVVEAHQSVEILKNYFALLFPSKWRGEGVAGTIIDSFAAGIPVIASDWKANSELIDHGIAGIIFPRENTPTLKAAMLWAMHNEQKVEQMRHASRKEFVKYMPETILKTILNELKKRETDNE